MHIYEYIYIYKHMYMAVSVLLLDADSRPNSHVFTHGPILGQSKSLIPTTYTRPMFTQFSQPTKRANLSSVEFTELRIC